MTWEQLQQPIDIQLNPAVNELTRITGKKLCDALKRTSHLSTMDRRNEELTWIDIAQDQEIWRMLVLNNFDVESVMHEEAFEDTAINEGRDVYDAIHDAIPKRPVRTEKSKRNNLPKLYAVWKGATRPEGKAIKLCKIFDSWLEVRPIIFKVSGALYISATNNAAGRRHLESWLANYEQFGGGENALLRGDGKQYFWNNH
jgi:hypothetical protein